jgi:hypothetical protein
MRMIAGVAGNTVYYSRPAIWLAASEIGWLVLDGFALGTAMNVTAALIVVCLRVRRENDSHHSGGSGSAKLIQFPAAQDKLNVRAA